jgi:putative Mn2+ efflux pump MntP
VLLLIFNSILLGLGLAMDAFSVSLVNGMNEPHMRRSRMLQIAGTFAGFQFAMPMIGWICVKTIADTFQEVQKFIPWIALILLLFIGGKMLIEGIRGKKEEEKEAGTGNLVMQGIATSIDALSVGFTMAELKVPEAIAQAVIIGVVTLGVCLTGIFIGRKAGDKLSGKATIFGGIILIAIGLEIFLSHML